MKAIITADVFNWIKTFSPSPQTTHSQLSMTDICQKLRSLRKSQSLSLADVESLSHGRIKAVVLGSYERGSRALSVKRALEIAAIYQIPAAELFREQSEPTHSQQGSCAYVD